MQSQYEKPEQIATAIHQGSQEAENVLLDRYYRTVLFILKKRVNDDALALDLCQETFRVMIETLRSRQLDEPEKLAAFLQKTALNLCIAENRKAVRQKTSTDSEQIESLAFPGDDPLTQVASERAAKAVGLLIDELQNDRDRKILTLYYIEEWEKVDVCKQLELDYRHFDRVISRARARFRQLAGQSGQEEHFLGVVQ